MDSDANEGRDVKRHYRNDPKNTIYLKREIHFIIEAPNGTQMSLRYKPEMGVEAMYLIACKKFGLSTEDHYVVLFNKEMDMNETLKTYNLTQNSVLKIYKGKKQSLAPDVFVSVRIRDCRIGSVFTATDNLWDITRRLLSERSYEPDMVPIVIYMKHEFIGEAVLKEVRLRDMGVSEGAIIIRFLQLKQEDLDQRKMKEDEDTMATLESLELRAAGPSTDAGLRSVHFRLSDDELDSENIQFIGERKALAFRLQDVDTPEELVQEDYFDLLTEEITVLFSETARKKGHNQRSDLINDVREELEKLKDIRGDFDDTVVRVQFPDRTCLQFLFLPDERIGDIKDFMKKFLKEPQEDYDLVLLDPHRVLDDHDTLASLKMVPVARLFFEPQEIRYQSIEQYMADEVILSMVPIVIAKEMALMLRGESLDRFFISTDSERDSSLRKSTGGFFAKFIRSSQSSGRVHSSRATNSRFNSKNQSSFTPRSWSRGSSMAQRKSQMEDDDETEEEDNVRHKSTNASVRSSVQDRAKSRMLGADLKHFEDRHKPSQS